MAKYRKLPVVIEAEQFDGSAECATRLARLYPADVELEFNLKLGYHPQWTGRLKVRTLEGVIFASLGDWIITGVRGERYPCKPDVFAATYEKAED
jgi:hypothetical protein